MRIVTSQCGAMLPAQSRGANVMAKHRISPAAQRAGSEAVRARANQRAAELAPVIADLRAAASIRNRDRGRPRGLPLPHHRTYGSVSGGSLDQAPAMFRAGAEGSDGVVRCVGFGPFEQRVRASPFPVAAKARYWNSAAWPTQGLRVYAFFQRSGLRQSALRLLCRLLTSVLRSDRLTASPVSFPRQQRRSPADLPR
jgi:hypothetical protein